MSATTMAPPGSPAGRRLLEGRAVVVTAAAGTGLGFATARRCAEEGARVLLSDRHPERLDRRADELAEAIGREVPRHVCDVRSQRDVDGLVEAATARLGAIDVFVNNAGLGLTRPLLETAEATWRDVIDVNLSGAFRAMRAVLPIMQRQRRGAVVNVSSICAWRAEAGQSAYAASKAGLLALTRCAAIEMAGHGVRVNAVVPSLAIHPHLSRVASPEFLARMVRENEILGRAAEPWEVGNAIVFLASDHATYLTGEALSVSCRHP